MTLLKLSGLRKNARSLPAFTWNADLVAFDGPLLSLFKSEDGNDVLFAWLDCDDRRNRWAIVEISRDNLQAYLSKCITLLDVFKGADQIIVFDATAKARKTNVVETSWEKLPAEYLPKANSFLVDEISTAEAKAFLLDRVEQYSIKLDGELYLDDLAGVPRLYQQLYSFHYGLEHLGRAAVRSSLSNLMSKWSGGFSAVNLFSGLRNVTPSIHRARLEHLQYNSPGHITMELLPAMAKRIKISADSVAADFSNAEKLYKRVYAFFKVHRISGFDDERNVDNRTLTDSQLRELQTFIDQFFDLMQWEDYKATFVSLEAGPLSQLRALLAYYRRLRRILHYVEKGQIELT